MLVGVGRYGRRSPLEKFSAHKNGKPQAPGARRSTKKESPSDAHSNRIRGAWLNGSNFHLFVKVNASRCSRRILAVRPNIRGTALSPTNGLPLTGTAREFIREHYKKKITPAGKEVNAPRERLKQRVRKFIGVKGAQVLDAFPDPDVAHGHLEFLADRGYDSALGRAVELCQNESR